MNKQKIFILVFIALIAVSALLLLRSRNADTVIQPGGVPAGEQAPTALDKENASVHPVSLQALMQKQYDGRDLKLERVLEDNAAYTRHYITYKSGELTISGIMNIPKGAGPFPVLVLNHGYIDPAIYTNGRGLRREQDYLARRGYAVIHPDYRNHAESSQDPNADVNFRLGYVEDVINAVEAVKKSNIPNIDKTKIGMLGHSMGGGVTLNAIVAKPDLVQAAGLYAAVSGNQIDNFNRWIVSRPETATTITKLYGTPETNPDFWRNISAINFLERITVPILILHGTADESVPIEWSNQLNQLLKDANKSVDYKVYPGEPHEFATAWPQVMQATVEFFDKRLK